MSRAGGRLSGDALMAALDDLELHLDLPDPFSEDYSEQLDELRQWQEQNPEWAEAERRLWLARARGEVQW